MLHTAATQGMAVVHLQQRGFTFVWRRRIPQDLVSRWKRRELTKSSHQTNRAEALRVARRLSAAADNIFAMARNMPDLTTEQLDQLARDYFERAIADDEAQRLRPSIKRGGAYIEPAFPDQCSIDADQSLLEDLLAETQEQIANSDFRRVAPHVLAVLQEAGLQVDRTSDTFRALAQRILRAQAEARLDTTLKCCLIVLFASSMLESASRHFRMSSRLTSAIRLSFIRQFFRRPYRWSAGSGQRMAARCRRHRNSTRQSAGDAPVC